MCIAGLHNEHGRTSPNHLNVHRSVLHTLTYRICPNSHVLAAGVVFHTHESHKCIKPFTQGMLQVPNPTGYKGIAIAKRKMDEPKTDEPIIYAYARIVQKRRPVVASEVVLGLAEDKDRVTRYCGDETGF